MSSNYEKLWEEHMRYEFELKDVEATMSTMTTQPFVNHIPTMTGGCGYDEVYQFYKHHFIPKIPADAEVTSISRIIGEHALVDELVLSFTHDREVDFMLPGIAATHKFVQLPHVVIVYFQNNKVHGEHIYWDQASLLAQIGLLDSNEFPVTGIEQAKKALDESSSSNEMMKRWLKK
ncbi:hypothetical protein [Legionella israelensis]|uniref:Dienelactone hydrolase n=1 Tax=Legionella israelensis TaxID=454 RepID=A0A0W0WG68_9GAMM|nr:hypothetical protein [Legionella israelensis]KTD31345.1 dienelactone hydrolase [Legionella israelensis]QBS09722.1 hypothetical protein E4T55_07535 [Legionella israelensis]SCY14705.1 carboxymethylenebutenolidase [Legionella israelensis DSM 19235]STX59254.1 dienelactone hydrolase [Legionella israelensis]